jgi:hypothetical protein
MTHHSRELPRRVQGFTSDSTHINSQDPSLKLSNYLLTSSPPHDKKGEEHPLYASVFARATSNLTGGTEAAARKGASAF